MNGIICTVFLFSVSRSYISEARCEYAISGRRRSHHHDGSSRITDPSTRFSLRVFLDQMKERARSSLRRIVQKNLTFTFNFFCLALLTCWVNSIFSPNWTRASLIFPWITFLRNRRSSSGFKITSPTGERALLCHPMPVARKGGRWTQNSDCF